MVAVGLALASACCYAVAAALQEHVAAATHGDATLSPRLLVRLARQPRWLLGVAATILGSGLHVIALGFGPLTLVQPIGAGALVFALPLGARLAGRVTTAREWAGAALVTVGLAGLMAVAPHQVPPPILGSFPTVVLIAAAAFVVAGFVLAATRCARPWLRATLLAVGSGIAFGLTSALVRVVTASFGRVPAGLLWLTAASVAVFAAAGLLLAQTAYRDGGLGGPLGTLTLTDPLIASLVGIVMLGESFSGGATGSVLAGLCAVTAGAGVITLARATPGPPRTRASVAPPTPPTQSTLSRSEGAFR